MSETGGTPGSPRLAADGGRLPPRLPSLARPGGGRAPGAAWGCLWATQGCASHGPVSGSALQLGCNAGAGQEPPTLRSRSWPNRSQPEQAPGTAPAKARLRRQMAKAPLMASNCSPQIKKNKNLLCVLEAQLCPTLLQGRPATLQKNWGFFQQNKPLQQRFETQEADTTEQSLHCPQRVPGALWGIAI